MTEWLLRRVSAAAEASAAIGDILEELEARRAAGRAPRWPSLWLHGQILAATMAALAAAAPRTWRSLKQSVRDALRSLQRAPKHAIYILLTLTLGMAAATITFSIVDAVVLRPLAFERSDDIVVVRGRNTRGPTRLSNEEFWAVHDRVRGFDSLASSSYGRVSVTSGEITEDLTVMSSTAELFRVLRLKPFAGRLWTEDDEKAERFPRIAVLGYEYWRRRFGADPAALNGTLRLPGGLYRIVGVMQPNVDYPMYTSDGIALWVPSVPELTDNPKYTSRIVHALGRLKPEVSPTAVLAEVKATIAPLALTRPAAFADEWQPEMERWRDSLATNVRGWMLLALACVGLVVVIACANAANLRLTRSFERAREFAVRTALGASRRQLVLTLLAESLMLSCAAAACALVVARWGVDAARGALPPNILRASTIALNGRVFVASVLAALVTGVLFGLAPAWQGTRVSIAEITKDGGSNATAGRHWWRSAFLVAQVACVGVLLVVSTLFITSFVRVTTLDLGFRRSNLIGVATLVGLKASVAELQQQVRQLPGVTGVAAVRSSPLPLVTGGAAWTEWALQPAGGAASSQSLSATPYSVTPDYFEVAGIPFREGSTWPDASWATSPGSRPIVIDEVAARRLFGSGSAVGRQLRTHDRYSNQDEVFTVVGVVKYVFMFGPDWGDRLSVYYPMDSTSRRMASLIVRTSVPPAALVRSVDGALRPLANPPDVRIVEDTFRRLTAPRRFNAGVMSAFALIAVLIGAAGIYAVMASVVAQRTREIGIRMALGATTARVHRAVLLRAAGHLALGVAVAFPVAWWVSRGFGSLLFDVRPGDPSTYVIVSVTLVVVGLLAAWVPARRAARVDPMISLRQT